MTAANHHWQACCSRVLARADSLASAIRRGTMNASAWEGVMASFIDQPAYPREWRADLLAVSRERITGSTP